MENEISPPASPTRLWVTPSPDCARRASDRIPKWLLPVIRQNLATGGELTRSAVVGLADRRGALHIALPRIVGVMHVHGARSTLENLVWLTHQPLGPGIGVASADHGWSTDR